MCRRVITNHECPSSECESPENYSFFFNPKLYLNEYLKLLVWSIWRVGSCCGWLRDMHLNGEESVHQHPSRKFLASWWWARQLRKLLLLGLQLDSHPGHGVRFDAHTNISLALIQSRCLLFLHENLFFFSFRFSFWMNAEFCDRVTRYSQISPGIVCQIDWGQQICFLGST